MLTMTVFSKSEKRLLALPVPCLSLGFLADSAPEKEYEERAELLAYTGPLAIVKAKTVSNLQALLRMLGAID